MNKKLLAETAAKYPGLKDVTKSAGWKHIEDILFGEYCDQIEVIKNPKYVKAEVEARAVIKFIERFVSTVNTELKFAEVAKEKYARKFLNQQSGE